MPLVQNAIKAERQSVCMYIKNDSLLLTKCKCAASPFLLRMRTTTFSHFLFFFCRDVCCWSLTRKLFPGRRGAAASGEPRASLEEGKTIPDQCLCRCQACSRARSQRRQPRDSLAYRH